MASHLASAPSGFVGEIRSHMFASGERVISRAATGEAVIGKGFLPMGSAVFYALPDRSPGAWHRQGVITSVRVLSSRCATVLEPKQ
ncbi:hypothetical protein GCM10017559_02420 [Streptosporangium longisporum]|uniref:Uncharacterized protein n=1 Tax=Streptosporangium longisporum TaxID=46187 RepID=A0ABP6K6J6_9ACTN